MGVLPMVWASFLSRTWPGVGGALIIEQRSQWSTLNWRSCPCSGVGLYPLAGEGLQLSLPCSRTAMGAGIGLIPGQVCASGA